MAKEISAAGETVHLKMYRQTDITWTFTLRDGNRNTINLTSDDVAFTVKSGPNGTVKISTKTSSSGTAGGVVEFTVDAADTAGASATTDTVWYYEVRRIVGGGAGAEIVYLSGKFTVLPEIGES